MLLTGCDFQVVCIDSLGKGHTVLCQRAVQLEVLSDTWRQGKQSQSLETFCEPLWQLYSKWLIHHYLLSPRCEKKVLSHYEQLLLWQTSILQCSDCDDLLALERAKRCMQIYTSASTYSKPSPLDNYALYLKRYITLCTKLKYTDVQELENTFAHWYAGTENRQVVLVGFIHAPSQLSSVVKTLVDRSDSALLQLKVGTHTEVKGLRFSNEEHLHRWLIKTHLSKQNHSGKPAVVYHDLQSFHRLCFRLSRMPEANASPVRHKLYEEAERYLIQTTPIASRCVSIALLMLCRHIRGGISKSQLLEMGLWQKAEKHKQPLEKIPSFDNAYAASQTTALNKLEGDWFVDTTTQSKTFAQWSQWFLLQLEYFHWPSLLLDQTQEEDWQKWQQAMRYASHPLSSQEAGIDFRTWELWISCYLEYHAQPPRFNCFYALRWQDALDMPFFSLIQLDQDAEHWPPKAPELPLQEALCLQKRIGAQLSHRLCYVRFDLQDQPMMSSPVHLNVNWQDIDEEVCVASKMLSWETIEQKTPPLHSHEKKVGTSTLQAILDCPAMAFIEHRLKVKQADSIEAFGLSPAQLGILIHSMLEQKDKNADFEVSVQWVENQLSAQSFTLPKWELQALAEYLEKNLSEWGEYLAHITDDQVERASHSNLEQAFSLSLGALTLSMRADRVDYFQDGSAHVIDYKTGRVQKSQWTSTPLGSVQLPCYALALEVCTGIHYASLHPDSYGYQGLSSAQNRYPKSTHFDPSEGAWDTLKSQWKMALLGLAEAYSFPKVIPKPRLGHNTCAHCAFTMLCRRFSHTHE